MVLELKSAVPLKSINRSNYCSNNVRSFYENIPLRPNMLLVVR